MTSECGGPGPRKMRTVQKLVVTSLEELERLAYLFDISSPKPLFRGHSKYEWQLRSPIERNVPPFVMQETGLEIYEQQVLTEAQRRLHHYLTTLPEDSDSLSWMALLRHHGVPTRLLDVTRSLFIACYFALRDATPDADAAVWIFATNPLQSAFDAWQRSFDESSLRQTPYTTAFYGEPYHWPFPKRGSRHTEERVTLNSLRDVPGAPWLNYVAVIEAAMRGYINKPGVGVVEPFWLTRRMDVQQGAFLIPFNIRVDFQENLFSFLDLQEKDDSSTSEENFVPTVGTPDYLGFPFSFSVMKVRLPRSIHGQLRVRLEAMNLRHLTLFPDVDGAMGHISARVPVQGY